MNTKSIFSSVTFWGSVTSMVALFFPKLFTALGWDPQTTASYIVGAIGFAVTAYGRLRATQPVTLTGAPKTVASGTP
jgi:hypothetical protein